MEVMDGWSRHCVRISPPMKPVAPVRRIFIFQVLYSVVCELLMHIQDVEVHLRHLVITYR